MIRYSVVQKLSLVGIVIGSFMSVIGACAPYWLIFHPQGFGIFNNIGDDFSTIMGRFPFCMKLLGHSCTDTNSDTTVWLTIVRVTVIVCMLLSFLCGLIALCLVSCTFRNRLIALGVLTFLTGVVTTNGDVQEACLLVSGVCGLTTLCLVCCTCCNRLNFLGVLTFLAAADGAFSAILFVQNTDVFTASRFQMNSYSWAFYIFCTGLALLGLFSFVACLSAPKDINEGSR